MTGAMTGALLALSEAEEIKELFRKCADPSVSDREAEALLADALAIARRCGGFDLDKVRADFAEARETAKSKEAKPKPKLALRRGRLFDDLFKPKAKPEAKPNSVLKAKPRATETAKVSLPAVVARNVIPGFENIPEAPLPPAGASALERLTYPRGLLGHAVQYIVDTAALPARTMALAGALSALAKALDRKVLGPTKNSTVLFLLVIAETGVGKQHILNCIRMLLRAMGVEDAIAASGIASVQSIEETLEGKGDNKPGKPSVLALMDEYGAFLNRISSKGQTGNVAEIPSILQSLWGWPPTLEWQGSMKVGKDVGKVYGPAFSIFGTSTERAFFTALKRKEVGSGFVNRHILFNVGRGAAKRVKPKYDWEQCPAWLVKALKDVAGKPAGRDNRPLVLEQTFSEALGKRTVLTDFRRIGWGTGAEERWMVFEDECRSMSSVDDRELWIRAPEIALRVATVVAVFRGSKVVDLADLDWGIELARHSTQHIVRGLSKHMLEEYEQADLVEHIREEFKRKRVLTHGQIRKFCERKTNDHRKIDWAIDQLKVCEEIEELEQSSSAGRPTTRWQWVGK